MDEPCEVYLKGKVVDVTKFQRSHPGGAKALRIFKNRDATEQFNMFHSPAAHKKLDVMLKGAPDAPTDKAANVSQSPMAKDFSLLITQMEQMGLYKPCYLDETFKLFLTLAPVPAAHLTLTLTLT